MVSYQANLAHNCLNGSAPHLVAEKVLWRSCAISMERRLCLQPAMPLDSLEYKAMPCTKAMPSRRATRALKRLALQKRDILHLCHLC